MNDGEQVSLDDVRPRLADDNQFMQDIDLDLEDAGQKQMADGAQNVFDDDSELAVSQLAPADNNDEIDSSFNDEKLIDVKGA